MRERGAEGLQKLLKNPRGILEYLIDLALSEELLQEGAEARAKSVQFVTKLISAEKDPTLRELAETYADGLIVAGSRSIKTAPSRSAPSKRSAAPSSPGRDLAARAPQWVFRPPIEPGA